MKYMRRKKLILARHTMEYSQMFVADALSVSQSYYSKIELDQARPSLEQIKILIKLLNITIDDL